MNLIVAQRKKGKIILDKFYEHAKKGSFFGLPSFSCLSLGPADDRLYYSWKWHTQVLPLFAIQSEENLERAFCILDLILL